MTYLAPILPWLQVVLSIIIIGLILLQRSDGDVGAAFGGSSSGGTAHTKRGLEKTLFILTIILAVIFAALAVLALLTNL